MSAADLANRHDHDADGNTGNTEDDYSGPKSQAVARSFNEALELASHEITTNKFEMKVDACQSKDNGAIECWIGGGERIYQEALQHNNAKEVQLTHIDMTVDLNQCETTKGAIARFPIDLLESCGYE
eukprot:CAMPEP_0172326986 /NCGR_PEP_ID=MMETSP1058-20130122/58206_1 /TAXON_ID=83371 /ORGANISM="Detonula confervacea, Strain CCMP 353" /LENGTH=126 /DNA_ID=CAMNT_0013043901 /DNA_START=255 /DNA_END=632 /DNA_ORIENTATION=+